jgi:hypothetical protein
MLDRSIVPLDIDIGKQAALKDVGSIHLARHKRLVVG